MTTQTLLEEFTSIHRYGLGMDGYMETIIDGGWVQYEDVRNLVEAIEREKAKPKDVAEVINDLTPTRRSCANCKFEHYDKLEAPCLPCRFYSNWEQKP